MKVIVAVDRTFERAKMTTTKFTSGIQTARTTWHSEHAVAGQEGRKIDLAVFNGDVRYTDGEHGVFAGAEAIEISDAAEPFSGTIVVVLADGSISHQTFEGTVTFRESPRCIGGIGRWDFLTGTGRFQGLQGGGTLNWTIEDDEWRAEFSDGA